ncbi:hypothetical protein PGT21_015149 [Puccinia graminis f. sp. tritici]|uniref:Uncharacterized protein n=1 Tax=Puccinia graminis f. sp. tritici TaxID=56615 RepID=A0A5B0NDU6_PUCGR|nr:hypothetical protein PGT21_015149 [Puccinia graminis f. sp. tritici]
MINLTKVVSCCLALHALNAITLAPFPGLRTLDALEPSNVILMDGATAARKAQIESLRKSSKRIQHRIELLDTQSKIEFVELQSQLEQLLHALIPPLSAKVESLSEPAPPMNHLNMNSESIAQEGSLLEPTEARIENGERLITTGTTDRRWTNNWPILQRLKRVLQSSTTTGALTQTTDRKSNARNIKKAELMSKRILQADVASRKHFAVDEPIKPGHGALPEVNPAIDATKEESASTSQKSHRDVLHIFLSHTASSKIDRWNALQRTLIRYQAENHLVEADAKFLVGFLKTLYLLGDFAHEYQLMPANFLKNIELFKPTTLFKMIEYHIDLLFSKWHQKFFDIPGSMAPHIDFLTTGVGAKHFSRFIGDLPEEKRGDLVYLVLRTILRHFDRPNSNTKFDTIREELIQSDFLEQIHTLSSASKKAEPGEDALPNVQNHRIARMVELAIELFENPSSETGKTERLEFQLVYYFINFLQQYHQALIKIIVHQEPRYNLFQKKLIFMGSYLNFYRNNFENYMHFLQPGRDLTFNQIVQDSRRDNRGLHNWIVKVMHEVIQHNSDRDFIFLVTPNMDLWMGQVCWRCDRPPWQCPASCHRPDYIKEEGDWLLFN